MLGHGSESGVGGLGRSSETVKDEGKTQHKIEVVSILVQKYVSVCVCVCVCV